MVEDAAKKRSVLVSILIFPFRVVWGLLQFVFFLGLLAFLGVIFVGIPVIFGTLAVQTLLATADLIFRTRLRQDLNAFARRVFSDYVEPFGKRLGETVVAWSDQLGLTSILSSASDVGTEMLRGFVLFGLFLVCGFAVYHLRVVRRVIYALIELGVAFVAVWIAIDGMAGGDFSLKYIVALLSGLYIMVRGLQNMDEGLRELADAESSSPGGKAQAWVQLWQAIFYEAYERASFQSRKDSIGNALNTILGRKKVEPTDEEIRNFSIRTGIDLEEAKNLIRKYSSDPEKLTRIANKRLAAKAIDATEPK